jgi:hypothetical protein
LATIWPLSSIAVASYNGGRFQDLNTLIPAGSGYRLEDTARAAKRFPR